MTQHPSTPIQTQLLVWQALTDAYLAREADWKSGNLSDGDFEDKVDPILEKRDAVEKVAFATPCECIDDLRILVVIASYFEWQVDDYNAAIGREADLLAQQPVN